MPALVEDYIETGLVKYVVRDYPLAGSDDAPKAAEATRCAADQGEELFWKMHDAIFRNSPDVGINTLLFWAERIGVEDIDAFEDCLDEGKHREAVEADILEGARAGTVSTPTFYIGLTDRQAPSEGEVKALEKMVGAYPYSDFRFRIESLLDRLGRPSEQLRRPE